MLVSGSGDDYASLNNVYYGPISGRSITSGLEADGTFARSQMILYLDKCVI